MSDPQSGIAEYRASIGLYPDREVLEPPPAFPDWTTFVSHRAVRAIAVAPASRIAWIATWGGVLAWNRKDEFVYRRYSSEHGLGGTPRCIAVGDDDVPWAGHDEGGLSYFDADRWYPYEHLRTEPVIAIAAAAAGRVWVATPTRIALVERGAPPVEIVRGDGECANAAALLGDGDGVLVASPSGLFRASERAALVRAADAAIGECCSLARDADGGVVVGTRRGIVLGDGTLVAPADGDAAAIAVAPTRNGIWVLTPSGLARVEGGTWRTIGDAPSNVAAPRAIAAARASDDYLWVGTDNLLCGVRAGGDDAWDVALLPNHAEDALSNIGRCAVSDRAGRVCIGTGGGLFLGKKDGSWSFDADPGDVRAVIAMQTMGGEILWMLAWPSGISRFAAKSQSWEPISLPSGLPRALVVPYFYGDPHALVGDTLWSVGGDAPVIVAVNVPARARAIAQAPDGDWFAATERGLFRYADGEWSLDSRLGAMPVNTLRSIGNAMWAGGDGACWSLENRVWTPYTPKLGGVPLEGSVTAFAPSSDKEQIWLAHGGRVVRFGTQGGAVLESYDRFDSGVCGDAITALAEVGGMLWVVSRAGIARLTLAR